METRYDHTTTEQQLRQQWQKDQIYASENNSGPLYSVDTPPPTVSGSLHIGHIFSYTQTDIIARYKRMSGYSVFYPFGFDDNGLPTERFVEKKRGVRAQVVGRADFIKICLEETYAVEDEFKQLWQRMGLSIDWDNCYSTISDSTRKLSQESFISLYKKGYIYRAYEPALYCTTCRTSVAQAELDDNEQASFFHDIAFADEQDNRLVIGTTRPELLFSCVALLYNPADQRYQHLHNRQAKVPLANHMVPILADEQVSIEKGTGLVMCCTFGDKTDIAWFKKFKLPYKQSVGFDGKWLPQTGPLAGLSAQDARKKVVELLTEQKLILNQKPISHAVNIHERCKKEIEYIALSQWFLKILPYKKELLAVADTINWSPSFMKARYINWVENISWDWCLSRQRYFGIPFPVWHCGSCNEVILAEQNLLPVDPQTAAVPTACPVCASTDIRPDTDVMDTWNTSSLTPYICYQYFKKNTQSIFDDAVVDGFIPMSMRPQAHDIIRTWAFYTIIKTWMHHGTAPWKDIVISGHVLTDSNQKISKSQGGAKLTPESLLAFYPADVIRFWTASATLGQDVAFSENQLKIGHRLVTKLWNAYKFVEEHTKNIRLDQAPSVDDLGPINQWLLHKTSSCFAEYERSFAQHEFGSALHHIEKLFWSEFCDTYIELVKHQLFNHAAYDSSHVAATRWTLYTVGLRIIQLYAPYIPYITDDIYQRMYKEQLTLKSLHATKFANMQKDFNFAASIEQAGYVIRLVEQVRKLKTEQQLSLKTALEKLTVIAPETHLSVLRQQQELVKGVTQAQVILLVSANGSSTSLCKEGEAWHAIVELSV
ncbi:MAG: valine--tRNA ligase [Epsilonproteobacteria bacterium]|nr:valine--tRNA ligase [Campylobacterota bacterium]